MSHVKVLDDEYNEQLLELTERCPVEVRLGFGLPGTSLVRFERSPDYFAFLRSLPGSFRTLGLIREGRLVASGSVIRRDVLWQGRPLQAEYVCDVRTDPRYRGSRATYRVLRAIADQPDRAPRAYAFVVDGNQGARTFGAGRLGLRNYRKYDDVLHLCFYTGVPLPGPKERFNVSESEEDGLWECLFQQWAGRRNLAPTALPTRVSGERRFVIRLSDRPVAVGSLIDQSGFRRVRVVRLCARDRWVRRLGAALAAFSSIPALPAEGDVFARAYVGNLAWEEGRKEAVAALVSALARRLRVEGVPLLYLGVARTDPLLRVLPVRWSVQRTRSALFLSGFQETASLSGVFFNLSEL